MINYTGDSFMPHITTTDLAAGDKTIALAHILKQMGRFFEFYNRVHATHKRPNLLVENIDEAKRLLDELIELHPLIIALSTIVSVDQHEIKLDDSVQQALNATMISACSEVSQDEENLDIVNFSKLRAVIDAYFNRVDYLKNRYIHKQNILEQIFNLGVFLGFVGGDRNSPRDYKSIKPLLAKMKEFARLIDSEKLIESQERVVESLQNPLALYQKAWDVGFYSKDLGSSLFSIIKSLNEEHGSVCVDEFIYLARFLAEAEDIIDALDVIQRELPAPQIEKANNEAKQSVLQNITKECELKQIAEQSIRGVLRDGLTICHKNPIFFRKIRTLLRDKDFLKQLVLHPAFNVEHTKNLCTLIAMDEKFLTDAIAIREKEKETEADSKKTIKKLQKTVSNLQVKVDELSSLVVEQKKLLEDQSAMLRLILNQQKTLYDTFTTNTQEKRSASRSNTFFETPPHSKSDGTKSNDDVKP